MKILTTMTCLILITSCMQGNGGRKTRQSSGNGTPNLFSSNSTKDYSPSATDIADATSGDIYDPNVEDYVSIPEGAINCRWSLDGTNNFSYSSIHLSSGESISSENNFNICRDKNDPMIIHFQLKHPTSDHQICFIPTTHNGTLKTYIGEPRCESVISANKIYSLRLYINRPGYSSTTMSGVMIMRDKAYHYDPPFNQILLSPDAFIYCNQWLASYSDSSYCQSFANGGHYEYFQFSK